MKNSQKGFIIPLVVVIAVLVIGGGAYVYIKSRQVSQTRIAENTQDTSPALTATTSPVQADETADWKTYTNKEVGFSFRYPPDWTIQNDKLGNHSLHNIDYVTAEEATALKSMDARFGYSLRTPSRNREDFLDKLIKGDGSVFNIVNDSVDSLPNENGLDVLRFKGWNDGYPITDNYIIPIKKDFSEVVSFIVWNQDPIIEKVLSTFKFTSKAKGARY